MCVGDIVCMVVLVHNRVVILYGQTSGFGKTMSGLQVQYVADICVSGQHGGDKGTINSLATGHGMC